MKTNIKKHERIVKSVQKQTISYFRQQKQARIFHGGTNSTRHRPESHDYIDISGLNNILEVNTSKRFVLAEPNVSLEELVDTTLKEGLLPPVISEFPAITVGGAVQGGAGESSSFKYGCFNTASLEYEVVVGDGSKVIASPKQNNELFYGIPSSCGSLGIITSVKLKLIPVTQSIKLVYNRVSSYKDAVQLISKYSKASNQPDYIDGIMFSKTRGVIMLGYFTEQTYSPKTSFHINTDEWFYIHA